VSAQVEGKRVVIYDDMIRTGGSLISAAQAYRDAGAASIDAIATHGVLPGDSPRACARPACSGAWSSPTATPAPTRYAATSSRSCRSRALLADHVHSNR
jgi:ribose-phosphate pyrophosphokinase